MNENGWFELIFELQLELLKRKSEWWVIGGSIMLIISFLSYPFFYGAIWLLPLAILGIFVLVEGILLRLSWIKMNKMRQT
ncbi:MAG: hypothetical protein ACFFCW_22445 [Candidatus Hodarchaeota archaeon]